MPNPKQKLFRDMILGTLIYSVVLGFFDDYTNLIHTNSYSTTFALAALLQALTQLKFGIKNILVRPFKGKETRANRMALVFTVWLVMFLSKFIFLAAIGLIFPKTVQISGFIGLIAVIVTMLLSQKMVEVIYARLGAGKI